MEKKKYIYLLCLTLGLLAFCLILPLKAALYYVRQRSASHAWFTEIELATSSYNNDKSVTLTLVIPSLIVIFAVFIHYLLVPIVRPENHHKGILPIFNFDETSRFGAGRLLSSLCLYTIPVLVPLGVYYVYRTNGTIDPMLMFLFQFMLMAGAFVFLAFYLVFFIRFMLRRQSQDDNEEWHIY